MSFLTYPIALFAMSALVMGLEALFPWRKGQKQLRPRLFSDLLHLIFNGHFLGVILYGISERFVLPPLKAVAHQTGLAAFPIDVASAWPLWLQIVVVLVVFDFFQWCIHNLLHRIPFLWEIHKTHHSVVDGEMDWIVSFRFHFGEAVLYKSLQYLPLLFFGFGTEAILAHAIFGSLIGHLNHSNLDWGHGPWRYILNSPRMHLWHHDFDAATKGTANFGIIFSAWDWIFGTAKLPPHPPAKLGFGGVEAYPKTFLEHAAYPLAKKGGVFGFGLGGALLLLGWLTHAPARVSDPVRIDEPVAASQPSASPAVALSRSVGEAERAIDQFGAEAKAAGFQHPEDMVSVPELARAIGSHRLVVLDVRAKDRFEQGHLPSAQLVSRDEFEAKTPIPGMSLGVAELEATLRARGVRDRSIVVLYGDGGAEPYRLWWTLREVAGFKTRVLDGGLEGWKKLGLPVVEGPGRKVAAGDVVLHARDAALTWDRIAPRVAQSGTILIDTRTIEEFTGKKKHDRAAKPGRIPGSIHLDWSQMIVGLEDPRLRSPDELQEIFRGVGVDRSSNVVTSCMTGTRSALTYFALWQLGMSEAQLANYNGSWSEYSRLNLPVETGTTAGH